MKTKLSVFLFLSLLFTQSALAWDGNVTGKIYEIDVTAAESYGFRVYLEGLPALCGNTNNWAYLNKSSSNYQTFVSVLLAANMAGRSVTLYTTKETLSGNDFCTIGYVTLRSN